MSDETAKIDNNYKKTLTGITDDSDAFIKRLLVDPATGRLKVTAVISSGLISGSGSINMVSKFTSSTAIGNSVIESSGGSVSMGSARLAWPGITAFRTFNFPNSTGTFALTTDSFSFAANLPLLYNGGSITIPVASATGSGYLIGTDWTIFNNKMGATTFNSPLSLASGSVSLGSITSAWASGKTGTGNWVCDTAPTFAGVVTSGGSIVAQQDVQFNTTAVFDAEYDNGNIASDGTVNWQNGNKQSGTITAATTINFIAPTGVCNLVLKLNQNNSAGGTIVWPTTTKWSGGSVLSTGSLKIDVASFYYNKTSYFGMLSKDFI